PLDVAPALCGGNSKYKYMHPNAAVHRMPTCVPAAHAAASLPVSNGVEWANRDGKLALGKFSLIQTPAHQGLAGIIAARDAGAAKRSTVVLAAPGSEEISVGSVGRRNLSLKWAHGHSYASVELAIQMIASGKYPMQEISTHTFGLSQVADAIEAVAGEGAP